MGWNGIVSTSNDRCGRGMFWLPGLSMGNIQGGGGGFSKIGYPGSKKPQQPKLKRGVEGGF